MEDVIKTSVIQSEIEIIPRQAIPLIHSVTKDSVEHQLGEVRDFQWHQSLKKFLPATMGLAFSWTHLKARETLSPHVHPIQTMIIVVKGQGQITGQKNQTLAEGDTIIVPPGCAHGFLGTGAEGFHALSIQFEGGIYTDPVKGRVEFGQQTATLQTLLDYNQKRLKEFTQRPLFTLIQDGTLEDSRRREIYLNAMQIWTEGNQTLLYSRQATCRDQTYYPMFLKHLSEEVGHDELFNDRSEKTLFKDSEMEAITTWFVHQMFVLDNIEKTTIIHIVIESASDEYHRIARPYLAKYINNAYFQAHEVDCDHIEMGLKLLEGHHAKTYARLHTIAEEAWDMLNAMVDRVTYLVQTL